MSASASIIPQAKQQYFTNAGTFLSGGKLYTYASGTSTLKTTWQDAAQTIPNTNPIILDSRGEATIYWSGVYKVTLKTSTDVLVWTRDGVAEPGVLIAAEINAAATLAQTYGAMTPYATWALLSPATAASNALAIVFTDTGTHTDPVVGGTVSNSGIFQYVIATPGWKRIGNTQAADADAARAAAVVAAGNLQGLLTQHPVSRYIGVATPAAGAGNNFGSHFALAKALPALTVLDAFDFYLSVGASVNLYAATATNLSGGFATGTSVFTLGANIGSVFYTAGATSLSAATLAPLGDLSGKFIVLVGQVEYAATGPATGDEQWVTIDTGTLAASVAQEATRKIQMKITYHTSDDHSADTLDYTGAQIIAALAAQPSTTTVALRAAVRANGFFPQPVTRIAANDVATITVGASGAVSAINGASYGQANVAVTNTAKISWLGGAANIDSNLEYFPRGAWYVSDRSSTYTSFEFQHTGTQFEVSMTSTAMNSGVNFRVIVGDKIAGTGTVTADGGFYYVKVAFPTSATRRVRIEMAGGRTKGLQVALVTEVTGTGRTYPLVTLIGDSFVEGTGSFPYYDGEGASMLRACGFNPANAGVGGTGLMNPGSGGKVNWQDANRLSDLALNGFTDAITGVAAAPFMGVIMASINDFGLGSAFWNGAATYQDAVNKALWVLIDHWNTQRPGKPLVVFGPTNPSGNADLDLFRMRDAVQEACMGASGSNVWFIDRLAPGPILRSGTLDRTVTTGNTNSNTTLNGLASTTGVVVGSSIYGTGIPTGTRVVSIDSSVSITMSNAATSTVAALAVTFGNSQTAIYTTLSDPTHPNQQGHNLDAVWAARQLRSLILSEFA